MFFSVNHLKGYIEKACRITTEKQVLLVSGGESLDPTARVCSYSAGTDTNPIYLFSKSVIEAVTPPCPSVDYGSDLGKIKFKRTDLDLGKLLIRKMTVYFAAKLFFLESYSLVIYE